MAWALPGSVRRGVVWLGPAMTGKVSLCEGKTMFPTKTPNERTQRAEEFLSGTNDTATWQQLSAAIGCDAQTAGRGAVTSARRILLRDRGIAFEAIPKIGLRRLGATGKVDAAYAQLRRSHRASKRSLRMAETVSDIEREQLDEV